MNIVYSTSNLYSSLAGISLTSLLINNTDVETINIIIMDNNISAENKEKLTATAQKYGRRIRFVPLAESLKNTQINIQKWNISTFGRLFEASSLPNLDKVIHVDCDTVVNGSLKSIWDMDMSHAVVAGAPDCLSDAYKLNIGLRPSDTYVNAGLLVLNLERIRKLNLEQKFLRYIGNKSKLLTYVDQEVLNSCVPEEEKIELPLRYNSYSILHYLTYKQLKSLRHVEHIFSEETYRDAINNPVVLHFTGCFLEGTRPWIKGDKHHQRAAFEKYKAMSQWADMPAWENKWNKRQILELLIVKITPKCILTPLIGYIHGVYVPRKNKRLQEE